MNRAHELDYDALALTDRESLAGIVRAHVAAKERELPFVVGAEVRVDVSANGTGVPKPEDDADLVLLATNRAAYGRLCRLLSRGRRRAKKGDCILRRADIGDLAEGLIALTLPDEATLQPQSTEDDLDHTARHLADWKEIFDDRLALAAFLFEGPDNRARRRRLDRLSHMTDLPLVATGAVEAHTTARRPLRDVLAAIRHCVAVDELGRHLPAHGVAALRSRAELARVYRPEEMESAAVMASRCRFSLDELRYEYPDEVQGRDLRLLVADGEHERWPDGVPAKVRSMIDHELALIAELSYENYFLTVYDLVRFARSRGILCQGRGSAANSVVCYALGITSVDPTQIDLLFERFVSKERDEPPDIDVDFEHERREEVLQYVYEKYGRDRAALAATVITYRAKSAIRDVGKALGTSLDQVDRLAATVSGWDRLEPQTDKLTEAGLDATDPRLGMALALASELQGFPRHLSQHVGGMVMTQGRLDEIVPIENAAMDDRTVIQWDKDDLEAVGLMKVDCLGLGTLTAIRKSFELIETLRGERLELATVPIEDPAVYTMACRADTVGVFQIESRAQMSMLPRLKPQEFYDLVIEVAIVRPGPIQGGMVHPYLRRRAGEEKVTYPSPEVKDVLRKTEGIPIFQEQVMKLAVVAAGFTPGEADRLRRAMGGWRRPGIIDEFHAKFRAGMKKNGYADDFAEAVFNQVRGFGEYGFPESHAASFALLAYVSMWLKRYEPAAFAAALLNSQPLGFYMPAQLVMDARKHGVEVRPVDVTRSNVDCTLEVDEVSPERLRVVVSRPDIDPDLAPELYGVGGPALRLGLRMVKGLSRDGARRLAEARGKREFLSVEDCVRRARLGRKDAVALAEAGAFRGLTEHRRQATWTAATRREDTPLIPVEELREDMPSLPTPNLGERVWADYDRCGLSLEAHPVSLARDGLNQEDVVPADALAQAPPNQLIRVAGLVICRQRPQTASGILFMTLEDETGHANLIVRRREQEAFRAPLLYGELLLVEGTIERAAGVTHVMVKAAHDRSRLLLAPLPRQSRNFH